MVIQIAPSLAEELDAERAWRRVWRDTRTDFLIAPVVYAAINWRPEVVLDSIRADMRSGHYAARAVRVVEVPKADHTTRPAGILDPRDRIVYQGITDLIAASVDGELKTHPSVFGFRFDPDPASDEFLLRGGYAEFRQRAEEEFGLGFDHHLATDVAAYFECVETGYLQQILHELGANGAQVDALTRLIKHWSTARRVGLPQGVWPSDYLGARVYLHRADQAMELKGHRFFRFSDDLRVTAQSTLELRKGLRDLVVVLRNLGLHLQSGKTNLLVPERVQRRLHAVHERLKAREDLATILQIDPNSYETAEETLARLTEDQLLQSEDALDALSREAAFGAPHPDIELCRVCIGGYNRVRSSKGVPFGLYLLVRAPSLTRETVRYLSGALGASSAHNIKVGTLRALRSSETIHGWQRHWLLHLLTNEHVLPLLTADDIDAVYEYAIDRNNDWPSRMMAIRLVGLITDQPKVRALIEMYDSESDADVKHAILEAARCLSGPERKRFYQAQRGTDQLTDLVIAYLGAHS